MKCLISLSQLLIAEQVHQCQPPHLVDRLEPSTVPLDLQLPRFLLDHLQILRKLCLRVLHVQICVYFAQRLRTGPLETMRSVLGLFDAAGRPLLEVLQGRGAPGPRAGESYVQRVGADTVFHLHAHPLHALDNNDPPLLDRRVLPRALPRQAVQKITFAGDATYPLQSLHRVLRELDPSAGLPQGPSYDWIASYPAGEEVCLAQSVYAYVDFLQRLTWSALHPADAKAFATARSVYIEDEDGRIDTLEVGAADPQGQYLRLRTTGHVATIAPAKAALLFPTIAALTDTLPHPGPYRQAEPF